MARFGPTGFRFLPPARTPNLAKGGVQVVGRLIVGGDGDAARRDGHGRDGFKYDIIDRHVILQFNLPQTGRDPRQTRLLGGDVLFQFGMFQRKTSRS